MSEINVDKGLSTEEAADKIEDHMNPEPEQREEAPSPPPQGDYAQAKSVHDTQIKAERERLAKARNDLEAKVAATDLETLRRQNPGEAAAVLQQITDARKQLEAHEQQLNHWERSTTANMQEQWMAAVSQRRAAEEEQLMRGLPEWRDPEVRKQESQEIVEYLLRKGYSEQQIENVAARDVLLARDALKGTRRTPRTRDTGSRADREIKSRNLMPHSTEAAALKIAERMGL